MTGEQDWTARRAGYPAANHPNRMKRPMPGAVTLSLWLNTTTSSSRPAAPGGAATALRQADTSTAMAAPHKRQG